MATPATRRLMRFDGNSRSSTPLGVLARVPPPGSTACAPSRRRPGPPSPNPWRRPRPRAVLRGCPFGRGVAVAEGHLGGQAGGDALEGPVAPGPQLLVRLREVVFDRDPSLTRASS